MTVLAVLRLYAVATTLLLLVWFADLWAKSYDLPTAQRVAKGAIGLLFFGGVTGVVLLSGTVLERSAGAWQWAAAAALAPPLVVTLWSVGDANWRFGYLGGFAGAVSSTQLMPDPRVALVASVVGVAIVGLATTQEIPAVRFRRYSRMLAQSCSCCGYKQRAVRELAALGSRGEAVIESFLARTDARYESRVRKEWRMCRATMRLQRTNSARQRVT